MKRAKTLKLRSIKMQEALGQGIVDLGRLAAIVYGANPRNTKARSATAKLRYLVLNVSKSPSTKK
ncbi:hypothetical protein Desca_2196 [Desulfotomaculum nigrificans CO-1-SRB]|uniref:Uncharacterized protein n=1 Tax=Desulfotomaculum nigrificans (strain DSM 14880 / VKM B-2319 / CO-1-SRB) TaxID=868595 RepID=F6B2S7_DESCC|nr:hypothetical protein [Desulfotomaculum nigrificans]AEF95035.1 hypothetical protein Desca_2196 [Desulfotomaculum nigrificans CO-1-SRB]